jgi:hypothetical protein
VLSDARVREAAKDFVCVRIDPRSPGETRAAFEFKSTRYVPEVVLLSPDGEVIDRISARSPEGFAAVLRDALAELRR